MRSHFVLTLIMTTVCPTFGAPPETRRENVTETLHGVTLTDPYRWLEDQNREETRQWIDTQMKYTRSVIGALPGRDELTSRVSAILKVDQIGSPHARGGKYFYTRRRAGQNQPALYMRDRLNGAEVALVDPNTMEGNVSASYAGFARDGSIAIYELRRGGEDEAEVRFLDTATKQHLAEKFPRARFGSLGLSPDKKTLRYTKYDGKIWHAYEHTMGADAAGDSKIFDKPLTGEQFLGVQLSENGRWLLFTVITGSAADKVEIYFRDMKSGGPLQTLVEGVKGSFSAEVAGDHFVINTTWNAPNGRVFLAHPEKPARAEWKEIVPESKASIEEVSLAGGRIAVLYSDQVKTRLYLYGLDGKRTAVIPAPEAGEASLSHADWSSDEIFYSFRSMIQQPTIFRYQVSTAKQTEWAREKSPFRTADYEMHQVWFESKDKTRVPMFIAHKKGLKLDGSAPAYLTAYGGFRIVMKPYFSARFIPWLDQGGVVAIPCLRGGAELGEKWHEGGMRERKQNTFDDFAAAAEWLIARKYTKPARLTIAGGSNGGLLVGAAMTQRPELFGAVLCEVPLLDMIRFHQFLVARWWVPEYGSSEDPAQFAYLLKYSPYQNVKAGTKYPAVMFHTGDSDTRVAPLHARKMTALMQASTGSGKPVVLHYDIESGHAGGDPVDKQIRDLVDKTIFLLANTK